MPVRHIEPDRGRPAGKVGDPRPSVDTVNLTTHAANTYASVKDVEALNRARKIGQGDNPTADDVSFYLEMAAGEINSLLLNKGYTVPISPDSPTAAALLRGINAKGAQMHMEEASPSAPNLDRVRKEYEAELEKLMDADFTLDAPLNVERARPRGPGLTVPRARGLESQPFFRRGMIF